jgi:Zn-dependent protease
MFIMLFSMVASVFFYSFRFGWKFATGFVLLIFVHEMGHIIAMRMKKMNASLPMFIPMLGAVIFAPKMGTREDEAFVGIGGPVLGSIGALAVFGAHFFTNAPVSDFLLTLSFFGVAINLFNMIPIRPLDGGRITQVVGEWFRWVGGILLLALTLFAKDPSLLLIWIIVIQDFTWKNLWHKFNIGVALQLLMFTLMLRDYGGINFPRWQIIVDMVLATLLNFGSYLSASKVVEETTEDRHVLPVATAPTRFKWFAYYLLVVGGLTWIMYYQSSLLRNIVK